MTKREMCHSVTLTPNTVLAGDVTVMSWHYGNFGLAEICNTETLQCKKRCVVQGRNLNKA